MDATYILPIHRSGLNDSDDLVKYLQFLARVVQVIVVDSSPPEIFAQHARMWGASTIHLKPDPGRRTLNDKVGNVLTGLAHARHESVIIADDDIRYDLPALQRMHDELQRAHVVRPQNYFDPLPWHARWDTARSLLNRLYGGDWPGTLGVRRSALQATGGYDGSVLFENYELVQTVRAAGGRESVPLDLYIRRLPPDVRHFWSQRIRQAYDEWCHPLRFALSLLVVPMVLRLVMRRSWGSLAFLVTGVVFMAEAGRRRAGGKQFFPVSSTLLAPIWVLERGTCTWLALVMRVRGGVPYGGRRLTRAASSRRHLRRRYGGALPAPALVACSQGAGVLFTDEQKMGAS